MHNDSDITTEQAAPWLASVPLETRCQTPALVIVHPGRAVVPPEGLKAVLRFHANGLGGWISAAQADNALWGYIDGEGQWRVRPTLQNARNFSEDGLARFCDGGRWGFVSLAGEVVIPPTFDNAHPFRNGVSAVQVGQGAWRSIDRQGQPTSGETFHELGLFGANGLARATQWKKDSNQRSHGFVDRAGRWVIEPRFRDAKPFGDSPATAASLDGERYGLINARGDWVLKPHYPHIDAFNSDGLAYFDEPNAWDNGHGYLDARGKVVVKGGRHLSRRMACGVVSNSYDGTVFLTADGKPLPGPRLSYGSDFSAESGFAVVRTAVQGPTARATWGLLHPDGRFVPAPAHLLEPLTNGDGWLVGHTPDTPLVPFLTRDGQLAYIDGEGVVIWRAHYDGQQVALLDAEGAPLWRSGVRENCWPPRPFFHAPLTDHLESLDTLDGIVPLASRLLAQAETRLHQLAAGDMLQADTAGTAHDDGADDEEDTDDPDQIQAGRTVVVRRVMRAYLSESHNGPYEFLSAELRQAVDEARIAMVQRLSARFGPADPDPEHAVPQHRSGDHTQAWALPLAKPLPGDDGVLRESREQWLTLYQHADSGDGDAWWELWLMAAPSVDALQLAQRARSAQPGTAASPHASVGGNTAAGCTTEQPLLPQSRSDWLQAVQTDRYAIGQVPAQWLDDAMVDAALEHDVEALAYVPPAWQTPTRLEALVRRSVREAASIPPECMTAAALALARALYAGQPDWDWRDERNSRIPTTWDHNSLCDVWACLLTPALALHAVKAQAPLKDLAHWLRTDAVEAAALQADIYNISYINPHKITPELAERAVRHDYGCLIEHIPAGMLTPALCLASVRANGLSLDKVPQALRSVEVCVAALQERWNMFPAVPAPLREEVTTRLIEEDLAQARRDREPREGSHWHVQRAWARLWAGDHEGAIADARLGLGEVRHEEHAHYILARACRALGREREAALAASTVLSLHSPYTAAWDATEDTRWLQDLAQHQMAAADDTTLLAQLSAHPRTLADIPRARITHAMVDAALAADASVVKFVPKRLMSPARYAAAVRQGTKAFDQVPADMLSEEACIAHVQDSGWHLRHVPEALRTVAVCAHALRSSPTAIELVPEALRAPAREAETRLPQSEDHDNTGARCTPSTSTHGASGWLMRQLVQSSFHSGAGNNTRSQLRNRGLMAAFVGLTVLSAKSDVPPTLWGPAGWLEQRPVLGLALHWLLGVAALVAHAFVSVGAWRAEGPWLGLATFALMGFSDLYWAWRFAFSAPYAPSLAAAAALVAMYALGWRWMYGRIGRAYAARQRGG